MNKKLTKEEIEHLALELYSNNYHARIGFINGYNLSDQNTKPLIDEIAELKSKVSNWMDKYIEVNEENKKLQSELKDKESVNEKQSKKIIEIINDSKLDKDAIIKVIVSYLTNQNK